MEDPISLTIKAPGKNKSGLQVKLDEDGYYYVSKVPRGVKGLAVGDRVLEINGVKSERFKNQGNANDLIDTFQLQIIPVDDDEGYATTDDELDLDVEEKIAASAAPTRSAAVPVAQQAKKAAVGAAARKKGTGRREEVEVLDDSESEEDIPKGGMNRGRGVGSTNAAAPKKAASQPKGRGRRDAVEYLDDSDDDDDDDEQEETARPARTQGRSLNNKPNPPPAKPGRGRREDVEYVDDDSDDDNIDDDEEEAARHPKKQGRGLLDKPKTPAVKKPGRGRREDVEYIDDDDSDDTDDEDVEAARPPPKQGGGLNGKTKTQPSKPGRGRREEVEYIDDDDDDDDDDNDDDDDDEDDHDEDDELDDTDDDEEYEEVVRPRHGVRGKSAMGEGRTQVETVDDENDSDSKDESYEDVTRARGGVQTKTSASTPAEEEAYEQSDSDDDSASRSEDENEYEDDAEPRKPRSRQSLRHSMAKRNDSKRSLYRPSPKDFDRPYVSNYVPMDRWMVTVKREADEPVGVSIVQYKKDLFVADVEEGPFYKTALNKGDKILSINGKKVPKHITSVNEAEEMMEGKTKLTVFVLRPDPGKDMGYQWVMENF